MSRYVQLRVFSFLLAAILMSAPLSAQHLATEEAKNAPGVLSASLRPGRELPWKRVSPTPQQPDGPVLYQIIFRSSATPGFVPKISNNFTLTNSLISESGSLVSINGSAAMSGFQLTTGAAAGQVLTSDASGNGTWQPAPVGGGGTVTSIATGTGLTGGPITTTGTISIANGGVTTTQMGSGAATNGQVLAANGSGGVSWQTLTPNLTNAWSLTGNSGTACTTSPCTDFLGTTDNSPIEVRVNNLRVLRLEPATDPSFGATVNVIGGASMNTVSAGSYGAVIAGGGVASPSGINQIGAPYAVISGGAGNNASGRNAVIGGGFGNTGSGFTATIAGGGTNTASNSYSTVAGGQLNTASDQYATVGGGLGNTTSALLATIAGGGRTVGSDATTGNRVTDAWGTVGGGGNNQAGNGDSDTGNATFATVAGGQDNIASGPVSLISGGRHNRATGFAATVAGGEGNLAAGGDSFAAGIYASANQDGCFVFGDRSTLSTGTPVACGGPNRFVARSVGGFQFIAGIDGGGNPVAANTVSIAPGTGIMSFASGQSFPGTVTSIVGSNGLSASAGGGIVTVTSNATPTNTASTIVSRDGLGNFASGTVNLSGNLGLPATTSASAGVLTMNTAPFLHAFGTSNTFLGILAGNLTLTGSGNTAVGNSALTFDTSGPDNSAFGNGALRSNTTGGGNSAFGHNALFANSTGAGNSAFGHLVLDANTTGALNSAFGSLTLHLNTTGFNNSAFGASALNANTIGSGNSAFGVSALQQNSTGGNNSAFGFTALAANTSGLGNSAFGINTLNANTTGMQNSALGFQALASLASGNANIAIGTFAGFNLNASESNNIDIGNPGVAGESNTIRIGDGSTQTAAFITGINGATSASGVQVFVNGSGQLGTTTSSRRFKQDIADLGVESDILMKLRPVAFYYKPELDSTHTRQYGLVAEEVAQIAPGLVVFDQGGQPQTVRYHFVNAMLLNEVQRQRRLIEAQQTENAAQQKQLAAEQERIAAQQQQIDELRREMAGVLQRVAQIERSGSQVARMDYEK